MATRISVAAQNASVNALTALLNVASAAGHVKIYTGTQPASVATAATGTLLSTLTLSVTAFGSASNGTATANAITSDTNAAASGTAGWFRAFDSAGTAVIDGSVTATGGGGDMTLNSTSIVAGGTVACSSWTITAPAG